MPPVPEFVLFSSSAKKLNGGIKYLFRLTEALNELGRAAAVCEGDNLSPTWFDSTAPLIEPQKLQHNPSQIFIIPEDQPELLRQLAPWPQKKFIYCQNHFYVPRGLLEASCYSDCGAVGILCASQTIMDYAARRLPKLTRYLLSSYVDDQLFRPRPKKRQIVFIPRKRPVEAAFLYDSFRARFPQHHNVPWVPLQDQPEKVVAAAMGESEIFLALNRLEGLGVTPMEALACGCKVVGFLGSAAQEYSRHCTYQARDEGDMLGLILALERLLAAPLAPVAEPVATITHNHFMGQLEAFLGAA